MVASDPEAFDCSACELRKWHRKLKPGVWRILHVYRLLSSRVVRDLHLTPMVFDVLQLQLTPKAAVRLLERLDMVHNELCPVEKPSTPDGDPDDGS